MLSLEPVGHFIAGNTYPSVVFINMIGGAIFPVGFAAITSPLETRMSTNIALEVWNRLLPDHFRPDAINP
jgi:hypothetical protein